MGEEISNGAYKVKHKNKHQNRRGGLWPQQPQRGAAGAARGRRPLVGCHFDVCFCVYACHHWRDMHVYVYMYIYIYMNTKYKNIRSIKIIQNMNYGILIYNRMFVVFEMFRNVRNCCIG